MKTNTIAIIIMLLIVGIMGVIGLWYFPSLQKTPAGPQAEITICPGHTLASSLLVIAKDNGYFAERGLNVTLNVEDYPSAILATEGVLDGRLAFTVIPDYTAALMMFNTTELRIISVIAESETTTLVARKDKGIENPKDLEGKKIGVNKKSVTEYFLNRFFVLNGLSIENVTLVDLKPIDTPDALYRGDVDAVIVQQPYPYQIMQRLDGNSIAFPVHLGQSSTFLIICNKTFMQAHPEIIRELLESLLRAEVFINEHNDDAKTIVQKNIGFDDSYMEDQWKKQSISLTLSQSLVLSMEDEARYMIRHNIVNTTRIPRYIDYINPNPLQTLKPAAVTIIRAE